MSRYLLKIFVVFALLAPLGGFAQEEAMNIMREANESYKEGDYKTALSKFNDIVFNYENSTMYPLALYKKAVVLGNLGERDYSMSVYNMFLKGEYKDEDLLDENNNAFIYSNYLYKAAIKLAEYNFEKGRFEEALSNYVLADTAHLYHTTCGNDGMENHYTLILQKGKCFEKMGRYAEALEICLKYVFHGIFAKTDDIVSFAITTLDKVYSREEIVNELKNALESIYAEQDKYDTTRYRYYLTLFGTKVLILDMYNAIFVNVKSIDRAREVSRNLFFFQNYLAEK